MRSTAVLLFAAFVALARAHMGDGHSDCDASYWGSRDGDCHGIFGFSVVGGILMMVFVMGGGLVLLALLVWCAFSALRTPQQVVIAPATGGKKDVGTSKAAADQTYSHASYGGTTATATASYGSV